MLLPRLLLRRPPPSRATDQQDDYNQHTRHHRHTDNNAAPHAIPTYIINYNKIISSDKRRVARYTCATNNIQKHITSTKHTKTNLRTGGNSVVKSNVNHERVGVPPSAYDHDGKEERYTYINT